MSTHAKATEIVAGQKWRSRDRRDGGLVVTVLAVTPTHVQIKRFKKTRVRRDRFHNDYIGPIDDNAR